jgi:hypothetical protein
VLADMLLPGYILTLDMAWTPNLSYAWNTEAPNNLFLLKTFIHALSLAFPSWVVQKMLLAGLVFMLFYIPWRFLPFVQGATARMWAAGIFALNPFVYARLLAGQWFVLLGYALLPLVMFALVRLAEHPSRRTATVFALTLSLLGFVSLHFLYLVSMVSVVWLVFSACRAWRQGDAVRVRRTVLFTLLAGAGFMLVNFFWIAPAIMRTSPLEARFDETHFSAFSAAGNGALPVMANVAMLGGFWGEGMAWRHYFVWSQDYVVSWVAAIVLILLVFWGIGHLSRVRGTRFYAFLLLATGASAYIMALGLADTPFKAFNLFLYEHVPLWGGFRDSHKIAGMLALVYAVGGGVGVGMLLAEAKKISPRLESLMSAIIFVLPVVFGMYFWNGLHGQLRPVWYPSAWHQAKDLIDKMPPGEKVLVLPWHGYLSLDFAGNRIVANPAEPFFGRGRIIAGRGVEFGSIRDQEVDIAYRNMDAFARNTESLSPEALVAGLHARGIGAILIIGNSSIPRASDGLTRWDHFSAELEGTPDGDNASNINNMGGVSDDEGDTDEVDQKTWTEMLPITHITPLIAENSVVLWNVRLKNLFQQ